MSKITHIELENFMSIEKAVVEFDETGILNLKGYNDSGKSAIIRACEVILYNKYPASQSKFIKDGENYFSVRMYFDDGVSIVREKYASGQSLYEMYKCETLLFTTKQGSVYTKVDTVPEVIQRYLAVLSDDEGTTLNSRNCFDPQLLVATTGGENYRFLNTVLHAEEMTVATNLLNSDKNAKQAEISNHEVRLNVLKGEFSYIGDVTDFIVDNLETLDKNYEFNLSRLSYIESIKNISDNYSGIFVPPILNEVSGERLRSITEIKGWTEESQKPIQPSLVVIDFSRLEMLAKIKGIHEDLSSISIHPELNTVGTERLVSIATLMSAWSELQGIDSTISATDKELTTLKAEIDKLSVELESSGVSTVKCDNCGNVIPLNSACC